MSEKKVHFSVPIHQIEYLDKQWESASRQARDGTDWALAALDRKRFMTRIVGVAEIFERDKIFDSNLRNRVFKERFESFVVPEPPAPLKSSIDEVPIVNEQIVTTANNSTVQSGQIIVPEPIKNRSTTDEPQSEEDSGLNLSQS